MTNDAAMIVNELEVQHPAAKILVLASKAQQEEIGDGAEELIRTVLHYSASRALDQIICKLYKLNLLLLP